jgi:general secretion pathway protein F
MPLYSYKGIDSAGKTVSGSREADGPKGLRQNLRRDSVFLTEVREVKGGTRMAATSGKNTATLKREVDFRGLFESIGPQDIAIFTRQLATLLTAGIPLTEAMGALSEQSDNRKLQLVLSAIRQRINEGDALALAMEQHKGVFPDLYINMVRSGETAGNLDSVLARLSDFLDSQNALKSKVSGALAYPMIMAVVGSLVMGVLMIFVVPQITQVFEDSEQELPLKTRILIGVAHLLGGYWYVLLPLAGGTFWILRKWSNTAKGKARLDRLRLNVWLIGPLMRYLAVARFARTLSTMLASGVPVLTAMDIVKRVLNNSVLEKVIENARDAIREGESVAAPLKRSGEFPSMMCHMVSVGERSGELETMLEHVAEAYERDVNAKVNRLTTMLTPIMIVGMAVIVGFVVYAIIEPIMQMQQFVQ